MTATHRTKIEVFERFWGVNAGVSAAPAALVYYGRMPKPVASLDSGPRASDPALDEEPSPPSLSRAWRSYKERVATLAQRIVEAQRPIRVLNAIKWPNEVFTGFRDSGWREMPKIGP